MRLNKLLSLHLGISRRKADVFIDSKKVMVNNQPAIVGQEVDDYKKVLVDGKQIPDKPSYIYLILNKPTGLVCSRKGQGSKTIYDILPNKFKSLNPVGRLDKNSCGLILLTNDGELHNQLTHPKYSKKKTYLIKLDKKLKANDEQQINKGVFLEDGLSKLKIYQNNNIIKVEMSEGRNRQIRRTFAKLGYKVTHLQRIQFGPYKLEKLKNGEWLEVKFL